MVNNNYPFVSTVQKYKKRTDDIARFLDETARKIGYRGEAEAASTAAAPPPVANATTNGEKKKKKKKKKKADVPSDKPIHRIRLTEFVQIAEAIATKPPPPVELPAWLIPAIEYTVKLRRRAADFYNPHAQDEVAGVSMKKANEKHAHFIGILERVKELLLPLVTSTPAPETSAEALLTEVVEIKEDGIFNRFEALNVKESVEADAKVGDGGMPPAPTNIYFIFEEDDEEEEIDEEEEEAQRMFFAVFCMFEDLNIIRKYVTDVWTKYKNGEDNTDLMTASLVTNTAIDLVRRMDEQFRQEFKDFPSYKELAKAHFILVCMTNGINPGHREQEGDPYNFQMADVAEWMFYGTYILLESFSDVIVPGQAPVIKRGHFGFYDPTKDRSAMDARERFNEDKVIMLDILPEFSYMLFGARVMQGLGMGQICVDEISRAIRQMCYDKQFPVHLVFAAQMYLDITHVLRERAGDALKELQTAGAVAKENLDITLETMKPSVNWPKSNTDNFKKLLNHINEWYLKDHMKTVKETILSSMNFKQPEEDSNFLLSRHPMLCGIMKFTLTLLLRECGITLASAWGSIVYNAHLYNAVRKAEDLDVAWPDMDRFMNMHTDQVVFRGTRPRSKQACLEQYNVLMGKNNDGNGLEWDKMSAVVQTFGERYLSDKSVDWNIDNVEKIIKAAMRSSNIAAKKRVAKDGTSIVALLTSLRTLMAAETPNLRFDYLSFHRRNLKILFELRDVLHDKLVQYFGEQYIERDDQISSVVGWILKVGVGSNDAARKALKITGEVHSQMYVTAAGVLKKTIEEEGSAEIEKIKRG